MFPLILVFYIRILLYTDKRSSVILKYRILEYQIIKFTRLISLKVIYEARLSQISLLIWMIANTGCPSRVQPYTMFEIPYNTADTRIYYV